MAQVKPQDGTAEPKAASPGRALIVVGRSGRDPDRSRPLAAFLVQLIASRRGVAGYRKARRAEPGAASSAYGLRPEPQAAPSVDVRF